MSIWTPGRIPGVGTRYALGVYLPYRKLASGVQIPNQKDRMALQGKVATWYELYPTTVVPGQATDRGSFVAKGNLRITQLMGSFVDQPPGDTPASTAGFAIQIMDAGAGVLWSIAPIVNSNALGSAQMPFWLRSPYLLKPNSQLQCTVRNLSPNPAEIQVVAFGYQD